MAHEVIKVPKNGKIKKEIGVEVKHHTKMDKMSAYVYKKGCQIQIMHRTAPGAEQWSGGGMFITAGQIKKLAKALERVQAKIAKEKAKKSKRG